jgi:Domain of unknown function (DUF4350)
MTDSLKLQQSRSRPFPWVWIVAGLLVLSLIVIAAATQSFPGGSTYGKASGDYSQWYTFMEHQGHPIRRWRKPYSQIKTLEGGAQTFIQIADVEALTTPSLQPSEVLDWVERGNTFIQLNWDGQVTGAPFSSDLKSDQGSVRIETSRRYKLGSGHSSSNSARSIEEEPKLVDEVAELKDRFGSVIWSHARGKGRVIQSTYPWIAANVYAQQKENFRVLEALAARQNGTIWVDEWLHGHRDITPDPKAADRKEQSPWAYLSRQPIAVVAGQGMVLLLLLFWGKNQRFGAMTRLTAPLRNNSEQYIQALADTLDANGHAEYVLAMLGQSFRQRLQSRLGMGGVGRGDTNLADGAIAQQWAFVTGRSSQVLLELLEQTHREKRLSERALLAWVQNSEAILRELPA